MGKTGKRAIIWLITAALLLGAGSMSGCGQGGTGGNRDGSGAAGEEKGGSVDGEARNGNPADEGEAPDVMGRYLEEVDDSLKNELNVGSRIQRMEDGSLVIISTNSGKWVSEDNGATWEHEEMAWFEELSASNWIMNIAVAKDGHMAVIYEPQENMDGSAGEDAGNGGTGEEEGAGKDTEDGIEEDAEENSGESNAAKGAEQEDAGAGKAGTDAEGNSDAEENGSADAEENGNADAERNDGADAEENAGEFAEDGEEMWSMDFSIHYRYGVVTPEGEFMDVEIPYQDSEYVNNFFFSEDNRLFGAALGGKIYEVDLESCSWKAVIELSGWAQYIAGKDGRLMMVNRDGVTIADMDTWEIVEDEALNDFLDEQGSSLEYSTAGIQPLLLIPGEEGILYFAFDKGIYRHIIGGSLVERVADGSLNSMGNPSYGMTGGVLLDDDVFLILYGSGEIMRYSYDPNIPAVPEIQLKAYSLTENGLLQTAISSYQSRHPEVYIRYETGINENGAATREDALKKLNAEIAAGKGPDFFLLDDMPVDSYVEKGVLMDLAPYLAEKGEDKYFTNIINAFRKPEGTFVVPAQFQASILVGKMDDIEKMSGLEEIAQMVEKYREEKADGMIFGARSEEELLNKLLPSCAPAWKDDEGKVNKDALEEFYGLAKRIWDAESAGISDDMKEEYEEWLEDLKESGMTDGEIRESQFDVGGRIIEYLTGGQEFVAGVIADSFSFDTMVSCFRIKGKTDSSFRAYSGQAQGVFVPDSLMGISSTSPHQDIAVGLLEEMLDSDGWRGMPVGKEKCKERFLINMTEDGSSYGSMGVASQDGSNYIGLDIYPASEEEIGLLMQAITEADTPYIRDSVLENAVCDAGVKVLQGEISAMEGAEEVIQETAIYMSE